jgi:hypothetical protein
LRKNTELPKVSVFNAVSEEPTEPEDITILCGLSGETFVMLTKRYSNVCRERFELEHFPFDTQELTVELRLNDPKTWDLYNLSVHCVQFKSECLQMTEWMLLQPRIKRDSPGTKATKIKLQVSRLAGYYIQNVIMSMFVLTLLGPLSFVMEISDIGSRVGNLLTIILTAVAFKFILASTIPKVFIFSILIYITE